MEDNDHLCPNCARAKRARSCHTCGKLFDAAEGHEHDLYGDFCVDCRAEHPEALLKATQDNCFEYALGLRDGTIIVFSGAVIGGAYVHLDLDNTCGRDGVYRRGQELAPMNDDMDTVPRFRFERGIDVLCSDIVWCADAPWGS